MKDKTYTLETIVGVLVLIIISLILKLVSLEINFLPSWFFENLFIGMFTLGGAFFGAAIAGKYAVNSVEKHIENNNLNQLKSKHETFLKIYSRDRYLIEFVIDHLNKVFNSVEEVKKETPKDASLIAMLEAINDVIIRMNNEYEDSKIHELAFEFYKDIQLFQSTLNQIQFNILGVTIFMKMRDLQDITQNEDYNKLRTNIKKLEQLFDELNNKYLSSQKVIFGNQII